MGEVGDSRVSPRCGVRLPAGGQEGDRWKCCIDVPTVVDTSFLQYIQTCVRRPGLVNILQWNWERFFFRHVELNSRFDVMTMNEVTFD